MKTNPFITLSNDPSSYGSEFNPDDLRPLNSMLRIAAERAGLEVFEGNPDEQMDEGNDEIDWFPHWCAIGHQYTPAQWQSWFKAQL